MSTERSFSTLAAVLATTRCALPAAAQSYSSKIVRLMVAYPPAGSVDVVARSHIIQKIGKAANIRPD
jgi:tripartite-type tricarboxylate transporter receptor subunit TctC